MMIFIRITYPFITYYESMITEQFIISLIKSKDKYFILYDKSFCTTD